MARVARWVGTLDAIGKAAALVLLLFVLAALAAPLITTIDPGLQRDVVQTRFLPPLSTDLHGVFHPLGTDRFGRDVWARLAYGARISLGTGVLAVFLSGHHRCRGGSGGGALAAKGGDPAHGPH